MLVTKISTPVYVIIYQLDCLFFYFLGTTNTKVLENFRHACSAVWGDSLVGISSSTLYFILSLQDEICCEGCVYCTHLNMSWSTSVLFVHVCMHTMLWTCQEQKVVFHFQWGESYAINEIDMCTLVLHFGLVES